MRHKTSLNERDPSLPNQGWRVPISLLSYRQFFFVWAAGSIHIALTMFETLSASLYVFEQTTSPFYVALLFVTRLVPLALFGSFAGVLAGRFNRRKMLLVGYGLLTIMFSLLALLAVFGQIELWHIYLGTFINGTAMAFDWPVRHTMMGELAGPQRIGSAMSLDMGTRMAMYLIGPAMGGLVFQFIGIQGIYLVACGSIFLALTLAWAISFQFVSSQPHSSALFAELLQGFHYARANRVILAVLGITLVVNIFGVHALQAMTPVIGVEMFALSPFQIGLLLATAGLGGLLGSAGISMYAHPHYYGRLFFFGTLLFFLTTFLFSLSAILWTLFPFLFLGGVGLALFGGMQPTLLFVESSPEMRSRVMGLLVVCIGAAPIGMFSIGILAEWLGASRALSLGGGVGILLLIASFFFWPELSKK